MATGKGAYISVDAVDLSGHARSVDNNFTQDEVESTVLSSQFREFEPTYERNVLTIRMRWNPTVQAFMTAHKPGGADYLNLDYIYGPEGNATGKVEITGTANVISAQQIPASNPGSLSEVVMTLNLNTAVFDVFA